MDVYLSRYSRWSPADCTRSGTNVIDSLPKPRMATRVTAHSVKGKATQRQRCTRSLPPSAASRARMGARIGTVDRPVRCASCEAESDMPADYTSATARVVLCVDHEAPLPAWPCCRDARVINLPFWSTLMLEFDAS